MWDNGLERDDKEKRVQVKFGSQISVTFNCGYLPIVAGKTLNILN